MENVDIAQLWDRGRVDAEVDQDLARYRGGRPGQPCRHGRHRPIGKDRDRLNRAHATFGVGLDVDRGPAGRKVEAGQGRGIEDLVAHPLTMDRQSDAVWPGGRQRVGERPIVLERLRRAEIEVEGDAPGTGGDEALQNRGVVPPRPRPRPAPERLQARRVDHDEHEVTRSRARPKMGPRVQQATVDETEPADQIDRRDQRRDEHERPVGPHRCQPRTNSRRRRPSAWLGPRHCARRFCRKARPGIAKTRSRTPMMAR